MSGPQLNKHAFIIHGWDGVPEEGWFPWLKTELEKQGYQVEVPEMPNTEHPVISAWVGKLSEMIGAIGTDEEIVLVGHSIGCQTILRTLELMYGAHVTKVVLVAAWLNLVNLESKAAEQIVEPWIKMPIDFSKIKSKADSFTVVLSDNDEWVPLEEAKKDFESKLGAKVIVEHNKGHFSGEDGITELPSALSAISD